MLTKLPNLLTLARIVAIVPIALLMALAGPVAAWLAFVLYSAAALTDWLDGYLARRQEETSALGQFLDPIADKLLVAAVIVMLVADARLSGWHLAPAILILSREILVSGLREFLAPRGIAVPVSGLAKWKTTSQLVGLAFLVLVPGLPAGWPILEIGLALFWIAAALTVITGWNYLKTGLEAMTAPEE